MGRHARRCERAVTDLDKPRPLNERQARFVSEYLVDGNATQAAIRAGYSARTAHAAGHRLLKHIYVAKSLAARRAELAAKYEVTQERVVRQLERLAFQDPRGFTRWGPRGVELLASDGLTPEQACALDVQVGPTGGTVRTPDRAVALDKLAKHLGLYARDNEQSAPSEAWQFILVLDGEEKVIDAVASG